MASDGAPGGRLAALLDGPLPPRESLPWYVAPLPDALEDFGLRLAYLIAGVNIVGTAFGFWYYGIHPFSDPVVAGQFARTPTYMWPFVPDSPVATLFIGLSLLGWRLGWDAPWLDALAFYGCIKLGAWTPYVLTVFSADFLATTELWLYAFLFTSHLAMIVEAFLIHRYSDFPVWAVAVALFWYGLNDLVDYFVPVAGLHHTGIPTEWTGSGFDHTLPAHELAAAGAVVLTLLATFLALATRVKKLENRSTGQ
ncbi:DUF1405 domain-containing protein [Halomarina litorea]|uniref:DUF1405 domain-containing protein n=1 Tax=Halomarina litorea TaxID=2961595 RepID=UPI0020C33B93|nr:DUF1405 domain-containing protein [Halomarina sp. BCD28]